MQDRSHELAHIDFSGLVLGLSSAALSYMGYRESPGDQGEPADLVLAQQNIAILQMLKEKTRGNLLSDEQRLLDQILADLQLKYVEITKQSSKKKL